MILETTVFNNVTYIKLMGERLDASHTLAFKDNITAVINESKSHIVLDLSCVKFMDSTGLGSIVSIFKMMGVSKNLILCGVTGMLLDLFKLTRMDRVFVIVDSQEDALQKC